VTTIILPVSTNRYVFMDADWPLTPAEWETFLAVLEAMKPGLLTDLTPWLEILR
jgi:hypothetical protein